MCIFSPLFPIHCHILIAGRQADSYGQQITANDKASQSPCSSQQYPTPSWNTQYNLCLRKPMRQTFFNNKLQAVQILTTTSRLESPFPYVVTGMSVIPHVVQSSSSDLLAVHLLVRLLANLPCCSLTLLWSSMRVLTAMRSWPETNTILPPSHWTIVAN